MPRLSAFYLPNDLSIENEYRVLFRSDVEPPSYLMVNTDKRGYEYIEIPLNSKNYRYNYKLEVKRIECQNSFTVPKKYQSIFDNVDW